MFAVPRYLWRKRWCVAIIMLRSVKYAWGYLTSVVSIFSCASGVLAGVAIRGPGKGGPFSIPSTARRVFAVALSGGGGGVTGGRFGPIRTGWSCGVWSAIGSLQEVAEMKEVAEVEDVVHHHVT